MADPDGGGSAVVVASEPLSQDDGWEEVPSRSIVLIAADGKAEIRNLEI